MPSALGMPDLTDHTAAQLATYIREGVCSSREVVEAFLSRIDRVNPSLNAVVTLNAGGARAAADAADAARAAGHAVGPLHGVPITVKDGFATEGLRTTFGLPWYKRRLDRYIPEADAVAVAALRRAGAIVLGKTNLPFASYDWQTRNPLLGRTNNPYAPDRTPGGSSGGSAAAVAARLSPLDLGSDVAGSIRVPAHFCGVLAMRPTEGTVSTAGMLPPGHPGSLRHALTAGPIARSVADLRLALSVVTGAPVPHAASTLRELRVAFSSTVGGAPVAGAIRDALQAFVTQLEAAGCHVAESAPPVDCLKAQRTWGMVHGFEFASILPLDLGRPPLNQLFRTGVVRLAFGPGEYARALARGYAARPAAYAQALDQRDVLVRAFDAFLTEWDVWMCPVAGVTAFPHRRTGANLDVDGTTVPYAAPLSVFNTGTALAGTPCVVLPVGRDPDGLPIGVQIHARRGADARLLDIVERMEALIGPMMPPPSL